MFVCFTKNIDRKFCCVEIFFNEFIAQNLFLFKRPEEKKLYDADYFL